MRSDTFNPNHKLMQKIKEKGGFINSHAHFDRAYTVTEENMEKVVNYHLFDKWQFVDKFKKNAEVSIYIEISAELRPELCRYQRGLKARRKQIA